MNKDFVPYQSSLDMKELKFDEPCFGQYAFKKLELINTPLRSSDLTISEGNFIAAPTFSQCFRWFREKYQIIFCYEPCLKKDLTYIFFIYVEWSGEKVFVIESKYNEEAELACLIKLIEIVKTK